MNRTLTAVLIALLVTTLAVAPAAAAPVDECKNADAGPSGDDGPPGFVADVTPDFISELIGSLPVPNFVKAMFGASTC